jgi:hypothetical protein
MDDLKLLTEFVHKGYSFELQGCPVYGYRLLIGNKTKIHSDFKHTINEAILDVKSKLK